MSPKSRKVEQGEATRATLLAVARSLFTERGFAGTATEDIVKAAEVTRGALYHHFVDKEDLFRAVFEEIETDLVVIVAEAASEADGPLAEMRLGLDAFLDACLEPEVQRVCLRDALSVLGWDVWYEVAAQNSLGLVRESLRRCIDEGLIAPRPVDPLAHILVGGLTHASLAVARATDPVAARVAHGHELHAVLDGLAGSAKRPRRRRPLDAGR